MQKLHLVGFTKDHDGLIFSLRRGAKSGSFVVPLDDQLRSSLEEAQRLREGGTAEGEEAPVEQQVPSPPVTTGRKPRPRSELSPREIQARLRAGSTIAEVAGQAGVDEEWVQRFAAPILAEQARVVERAQRLTFAKSRLGPSSEPLVTSVQINLNDRGVHFSDDVFADSWSAYNLHGTRWAVRFAYTSRQRRQVAEWEVDLREGTLTARNRLASDLGHVEPGRRRGRSELVEAPAPPAAPTRAGGRGASAPAGRAAVPAAGAPAAKKAARGALGGPTGTAGKAGRPAAGKVAKASPPVSPGRAEPPARPVAAGKLAKAGPPPSASKAAKAARPSGAGKTAAGGPRKAAGREASSRSSRPAKKPPADTPPAGAPAPTPAVDERPSHLARPPSPMNRANRATVLPGRPASRAMPVRGALSPRTPPAPPEPPPAPPAPAPEAAPEAAPELAAVAEASAAQPPAAAEAPAAQKPPRAPAPAPPPSPSPEARPRAVPPVAPTVRILSTPPPAAEAPPPSPGPDGAPDEEGGAAGAERPPSPPTRRPTSTVRVRRSPSAPEGDDAPPAPARERVRRAPGATRRPTG